MSTTEELLQAYAKELKVRAMTVEQLIESHRHLRSLNLELSDTKRQAIAEGRRQGKEQAREEALSKGWFSRERLQSMTLIELAQILVGPDRGTV